MDELKQKILADIHQTGFVTELLVGSKLIKQGWTVEHGASYFDPDSGKSRELDIIATKVKREADLDFYLVFQLIIQVKTSKRPWVVFSSPARDREIGWLVANSTDNFIGHVHLPYPRISKGIMRQNRERTGTAFHEAFKSSNETSQMYEALVSACKATSYQVMRYENDKVFNDSGEGEEFSPQGMKFLRIFSPLVILDGLLFEAFADNNGDIQIEEQRFIPVDFTYSQINKYSRKPQTDPDTERYFPDVITLKEIENYLALVENWQNEIFTSAILNLRIDIKQMLKKASSKKHTSYGRRRRSAI